MAKVEQLKRRVEKAAAALGESSLRVVFQLCAVGGDYGHVDIEGKPTDPGPDDCILTIRADMLPLLLSDKDFIVLHGGRDGAKSGTVARWLIGKMVMGRERVLAIRESRFAITRSLQRLILDIIEADPKLSEFFPLDLRQQEKIQAKNGSEIFFLGLRDYRASTVRSYQGVTLCWVEEAQDLSRLSLDVLIPTIREAGSQILFTLNPHRESDPVYRDFIARDDTDAATGQFLYDGNPWLSEKTLRRVQFLRQKDPEQFAHVYGGEIRSYSESRIYERVTVCKFDIQTVIDRRLQTEIKSNPMLPMMTRRQRIEAQRETIETAYFYGLDFGASAEHPACLLEIYLDDGPAKSIYITGEAYKVATDPAVLLAMCSKIPRLRSGWPIRCDDARPDLIYYMQKHGFNAVSAGKGKVADGIDVIRQYEIFIAEDCENAAREITGYSWQTDRGGEIIPVPEKKRDHAPDALRYGIVNAARAMGSGYEVISSGW